DKNHFIIGNQDSQLFLYTELDAPNGRVVQTNFSNPAIGTWVDLIPETENVLEASTGGGKIFASYLKDATTMVKQYDLTGKFERDIPLPGLGTASGFGAKSTDKELYYSFTNYVNPGTIYKYDITEGKSEIYKKSAVQFDPEKYESKQVFYPSKDGTKIPMIITFKKGIKLDGNNPTL